MNVGDSDTDDQQTDSDDYGTMSDDGPEHGKHDKDIQSSNDEASLSPKSIHKENEKKTDSVSNHKPKSSSSTSLDILMKVFPNHKTSSLLDQLKQCNGDVLLTIERLLGGDSNGGINRNGKRKNSDLLSEGNKQRIKVDEIQHSRNSRNNSPNNLVSPIKSSSPKSINCLSFPTNIPQLQHHQQPFLTMLTNMSNNTAGIPPPLVSSSTTSKRASTGSRTSNTHNSSMGSQYSQNMNLASFPRGIFGNVASPYGGMFPTFSTPNNLNFGLFGSNNGSLIQQHTQNANCPATTPYTMPSSDMISPIEHLHAQVKRNSGGSMISSEWLTREGKKLTPEMINLGKSEGKKATETEFVPE